MHGQGGIAMRYDRFAELLDPLPAIAADLPGELLHFLDPGRYWLWTRWMWDPDAGTGALALVTMDDTDLDPAEAGADAARRTSPSAGPMAFVEETGKAAGFTDLGPGLFGTDVFLAAVYGVYMQTVLRHADDQGVHQHPACRCPSSPGACSASTTPRQEGLNHACWRAEGPAEGRRVRRRHGRLDHQRPDGRPHRRTGTGCSSRG